MSSPRVSVVLPVRNEERYVEAAVRSVLDQSFTDFELIVIDNGSNDGTGTILARLAAEDSRIAILHREEADLVGSFNAGIAAGSSEYVARMDGDDISLPDRFALQVAELDTRPRLGVVGTQVRYIDEAGRPLGLWRLPVGAAFARWTLFFGTPLAHPSVMMRRAVLPQPAYTSDDPHAEDYALWARLVGTTELDNLPTVLFERRVHGASVSDLNEETQRQSCLAIQRRAIAASAGVMPTPDDIRLLTRARAPRELLRATRLLWLLYRASSRGPAIRRDVTLRLKALLGNVVRRR